MTYVDLRRAIVLRMISAGDIPAYRVGRTKTTRTDLNYIGLALGHIPHAHMLGWSAS